MQQIKDLLYKLEVGAPVTCQNLSVFPLLNDAKAERDYLTLEEALQAGLAEVSEVSSSGSVNYLKFTNRADIGVLLLDGEELVGAKQNRVLNLTIFAPAKQTINIPVSCVEQGRWSYRSQRFDASPQVLSPDIRARKQRQVLYKRDATGEPLADQGAIWQDIAAKQARMNVHSDTGAYLEIYERHQGTVEDYTKHFSTVERQVGAVFSINGRICNVDLFDCEETFRIYFPKLLRAAVLDAIDFNSVRFTPLNVVAVRGFLDRIAGAEMQVFPAVGEGEDIRLRSASLVGSALLVRGRVVHLCAFVMSDAGAGEPDIYYGVTGNVRRRRFWL